jgi:hypothetical protein
VNFQAAAVVVNEAQFSKFVHEEKMAALVAIILMELRTFQLIVPDIFPQYSQAHCEHEDDIMWMT